jgi:hypothetical protein
MKKLETVEQNLPSIETKLGELLNSTDKLDKSLSFLHTALITFQGLEWQSIFACT